MRSFVDFSSFFLILRRSLARALLLLSWVKSLYSKTNVRDIKPFPIFHGAEVLTYDGQYGREVTTFTIPPQASCDCT